MREQQPLISNSEPAREQSGTFFGTAEILVAARQRRIRLVTNGFFALMWAGAIGLGIVIMAA